MPVNDALLNAAKANSPEAIAMMTLWGFGQRASLGGSLLAGWLATRGSMRQPPLGVIRQLG